jgi:hypothetical protein
MAQQTAVEWLEQQLFNKRGDFNKSDIEQAKAMEKQQMKDAVIYGLDEDGHTGDWKISVAENYYIKTYTK